MSVVSNFLSGMLNFLKMERNLLSKFTALLTKLEKTFLAILKVLLIKQKTVTKTMIRIRVATLT